MASDEDEVGVGEQTTDVALTIFGVVVGALAILLLVSVFIPTGMVPWIGPLVRPFGVVVLGFEVWQIVTISILAIGSWLLLLDTKSDSR